MDKKQEKTDIDILIDFLQDIITNQVDMPGEFIKLRDENFWELVD